jgi:hypothetical protein
MSMVNRVFEKSSVISFLQSERENYTPRTCKFGACIASDGGTQLLIEA